MRGSWRERGFDLVIAEKVKFAEKSMVLAVPS
jgi:hypothetical protein